MQTFSCSYNVLGNLWSFVWDQLSRHHPLLPYLSSPKEKAKARMIWKNMNETCLHLFSSCTDKKKTLRLDFATVVDKYNDLVIIL